MRRRVLTFVVFWKLLATAGGVLGAAEPAELTWITETQDSARGRALELLRLLSEGQIEEAAKLSNAPARRREVLEQYRRSVGAAEFRRIYSEYFTPANRIVAEAALGERRLIIWQLGGAGNRLAGQFFVREEGGYLLDDVPSAERSRLQRALEDYRRGVKR